MVKLSLAVALGALTVLTGCQSRDDATIERQVVQNTAGTVNAYLWRASLDTLESLPVKSADPLGGLINYDWKSFEDSPNERIKATVYLLDTRLRADGVKVTVFRQTNEDGVWVDATVDPATGIQLENKILERARNIRNAQLG